MLEYFPWELIIRVYSMLPWTQIYLKDKVEIEIDDGGQQLSAYIMTC
jgi:hypothetical protein